MTVPLDSANSPELPPADVDLRCVTCESGRTLAARGSCCRDFRSTLSSFATGVTVITALTPEDEPIGVTISSFNSVSLDPPLILWSLSVSSPKLEAFQRANHYAVNILAAGQQALSDRFAARGSDRFAGLRTRTGLSGVPLLEDCCAWFECTNEAHYPGGDHIIFLGHVERFALGDTDSPLVFHNGGYRRLAERATG